MSFPFGQVWSRKPWLILVGILVCIYAMAVLWYVQSIPDIGLRCAFDPSVKSVYESYLRSGDGQFQSPEPGDTIIQLGSIPVETWPQLLRALLAMRYQTPDPVP